MLGIDFEPPSTTGEFDLTLPSFVTKEGTVAGYTRCRTIGNQYSGGERVGYCALSTTRRSLASPLSNMSPAMWSISRAM